MDLIAATSEINENHIRGAKRLQGEELHGRGAEEGSSNAVLLDIPKDNQDEENLKEEGGIDIESYVDSSEGESDPDVRYEDDDEDEQME